MRHQQILWSLMTLGFSLAASGNPYWRPIVSIGGGAVFASPIGESQTIPIADPITDEFYDYHPNNTDQTVGAFDIFVGTEWGFSPKWALQMGFGYQQQGHFDAEGYYIQGADEQSADQYNYAYEIKTKQLMVESKLLYEFESIFHPYLFIGLGTSFNTANNFYTTAPATLTFTRDYESNTEHSFTYSVGVGFDIDLNDDLRIGLGYRFSDLGEVELGQSSINNTPVYGHLTQDHLYVNELILQLTLVPLRN